MPKVSVIIPNYNHATYLERRIESVVSQSFEDFEVILLDDCSTDNSLDIINKYRHHHKVSKVLLNEKNSGSTFKQWNKGISEAKGSYIWIAESDDYADPNFLAELVPLFRDDNTVSIAYCQSYLIDAYNTVTGVYELSVGLKRPHKWESDFYINGQQECAQYLIHRNTIPNASAVLFRKEVYEEVGGASEHMRVNGDWHLWIRMLQYYSLAFRARPLNYYRVHTNNVRSKTFIEGTGVEEYYQIMHYCYRHGTVSPDHERAFKYTIIHRWIDTLTNPVFKIPFSRHIRIYKLIRSVDTRANWHILKTLMYIILRKGKRLA